MKPLRLTVLGSLIGGAFLTLAAPSDAAFHARSARHSAVRADREALHADRHELRADEHQLFRDADRHELRADEHQLFRDRRDGAGPAERADDRANIRQDRQNIAEERHDLRVDERIR